LVHRVVITSSLAGIAPPKVIAFGDTETTFTADCRPPFPEGPFVDGVSAYCAAKARELNAIDMLQKEHEPHFSIVNVMPSITVGPNLFSSTFAADGNNRMILNLGMGSEDNHTRPWVVCGISDVARVHVGVLDETKVVGSADFGINVSITSWNVIRDWALEAFPEAVEKGILKPALQKPGSPILFNTDETEEKFGKFSSLKQDVIDLYAQRLKSMVQ
jgi:hypothetical protein